MFTMRLSVPLVLVLGAAVPAAAQSEADLRDFFEGKSVRLKIDMPGTQEGVDVYPDARRPMDFQRYAGRLKSYGTAVRTGESIMVTRIRVKEKLIEFHLGGGGYGTFGDDTGSVTATTASKTQREKDLEKLVKNETNADRKRRLQRELDDLRRDREREDNYNRSTAAAANEIKKDRVAEARLRGGSRFNLRYQNGVPPGITVEGIMAALDEYLEFPWVSDRPPSGLQDRRGQAPPSPPPAAKPAASGVSGLRKGLTMSEVNLMLGSPAKTASRTEGAIKITTATYNRGDQVVTVDFVEGVVVKYAISSK